MASPRKPGPWRGFSHFSPRHGDWRTAGRRALEQNQLRGFQLVRVWRICRKMYAKDALSGKGGLFVSGRWHSRGRPIVYSAQSISLAALEMLVHTERSIAPRDLVQVEISIPQAVQMIVILASRLQKGWQQYPAPVELQEIGDTWLQAMTSAVLEVPSAVVPEESNYLINPLHPDAAGMKIVSVSPFVYDRRLLS